jgi:DNA helicase-2/ATP-dependent DNA helicase PcrA
VSSSSRNELTPDPEQQAAIDATEPAIAVLAGPGSGKTSVLAHRARRLLVAPTSRALLLTFTNKAAAEMKARLMSAATITSNRVFASTFHTFAMHVLRSHGDVIGVNPEFEVLDSEQMTAFSQEASVEAGIVDQFARWSFLRLRRLPVPEKLVVDYGAIYSEAKRSAQVLDFDDLIVYTADLFERRPDIASAYAMRYPHMLVDEFQDTNAAQFAIVRALASHTETVSVFADDDQAIYQFAGAESANVRRFTTELGAQSFPLTYNYRCRKEIVDRANRLIASDPSYSGRQMQAVYPGGHVLVVEYDSPDAEAESIAEEVARLIDERKAEPSDIAILSRASPRLKSVLQSLQRRNVPVSNWLADSYGAGERAALRTCLLALGGTLTEYQARQLTAFLGLDMTEERDTTKLLEANAGVRACSLLIEMRRLAWEGAPLAEVMLAAQHVATELDPDLADGFITMIEAVDAFQAADPDFSLDHLSAELALRGSGGAPTSGGGVKVASLHKTKGLQWPRVYMLGLENGTLPHYRATSADQLREERRICFVGVTRTESVLTLTHVRADRGHRRTPSTFLLEMGL